MCYTCVCRLAPWHTCQLTTFRNLFSLPFRVPGIHLGPSGLSAKWHLDSLVVFIIYLGLFLPAIYSNYRFRNKEISANLSFQRIFSLYCKDTNPAVHISVVVARVCYAVYACVCTQVCGDQRLEVRGWHWICSISLSLPFETESLAEPSSLIKQDNLAREFQESPYLCLPSARITDKHHRLSYIFTWVLRIQI